MTPSIGTTLKINVSADFGAGLKMDDAEFTCTFFTNNRRSVSVRKADMLRIDENNYLAVIDSRELGAGTITMLFDGEVDDGDCPDGKRHEVLRVKTGITIDI